MCPLAQELLLKSLSHMSFIFNRQSSYDIYGKQEYYGCFHICLYGRNGLSTSVRTYFIILFWRQHNSESEGLTAWC